MIRYVSLLFVIATLIVACSPSQDHTQEPVQALDLSNIDTAVRIQDDLFRFVNGGWIQRTSIPVDKSRWGAFNELRQNNKMLLRSLFNDAISSRDTQSADQLKAIDFYQTGMDSLLAEKLSVDVLNPIFAKIDKIATMEELQAYLVESTLSGVGNFFGFGVLPDLKNSKKMSAYMFTGGLGLPERDYYLKTDERSVETREKYLAHIQNMFSLTAMEIPESAASFPDQIMDIETRLATSMLSKEDRRDVRKLYNRKSISQLDQLVPSMDWDSYFQALGVQEDSIIVTQPAFMETCERIFASGRWSDIHWYLKWSLINRAANYLNHALVQGDFEFYRKYLEGVDKMEPRWKRTLVVTDRFLGQAIGQLYVAKAFPDEAKQKALEMVGDIKIAMADRIKNLDWMSDSTKIKALDKLRKLTVKIGYPDEWRKYDGMEVGTSSFYDNVVKASRFEIKRNIAKLGKPVDRKEWTRPPQEVNAFYNPLFNEIVFPAGILQPPFYNYRADLAVNYGGIGMVIGHEISHAFDDSGSRFDADGNLNNWWTPEDLEKFEEKGKKLVAQFDAYEPLPNVFVQGKFTLGENIGDLCGITVAYDALEHALKEKGRPGKIDNYTPEQRFFLSLATIWRYKIRDDAMINRINTDPHAPPQYRVNGPTSNIASFYKAFDIKEGDSLYRSEEERVHIW